MPDTGPIQAYTYYKLLAKWKNNYLIETIHSGGGSGEFTTLRTVQRRGDHLKISTLAQGDRCNGGLSKFTLKGKTFSYQINITPFDFLTLTQDNSHHLQAYKDLDACAVCCAGTLLVTRAFGSNIKSETKISVDFSHYVLNLGDQSHESNYQSCFNTLINEYKKKRKTVLTMDELKQFVQQFNQSCTVKN